MINKEALQQIADLIRAEMDWRNRIGVSTIKKTSRRRFRKSDARKMLLNNWLQNTINFTSHSQNQFLMKKGLRQIDMIRLCNKTYPHLIRKPL